MQFNFVFIHMILNIYSIFDFKSNNIMITVIIIIDTYLILRSYDYNDIILLTYELKFSMQLYLFHVEISHFDDKSFKSTLFNIMR
jgi:hypothetical protein